MKKGLLVLLSLILIMSFIACAEDDETPPLTYSVTYDINGGNSGETAPVDNKSYEQGDTVIVLGAISKSKVGGTEVFDGWNPIQNYSGDPTLNYSAGNTFVMGSTNVFLYGQWHTVY